MKKTSLTRFNAKAWRNGLALLLLLCFVSVGTVSAQSVYGSTQTESIYVPSPQAQKMLQQNLTTLENTVKVTDIAERARRKFYAGVQHFLLNGLSVEAALDATRDRITQKAMELGTLTVQDVDSIYAEIDELLRI